ncbi:MAG: hypothetical protein AB1416_06345 [Actinomycetota bacterium]
MTVARRLTRSTAVALAVALLAIAMLIRPAQAEALPNPCDWAVISAGCQVVGAAGEVVGEAIGGIAGAAGRGVLGELTGWVADGATWLVSSIAQGLDHSTRVDLDADWFTRHYRAMFAAGGLLLLPFLLLACLQTLLRQDWTLLMRAVFLYLPGAMLATLVAVAVTQGALAATDAISADLARGVAHNASGFADRVSTSLGGGVMPLFVGFLIGLVMALAALFVWIELILRAAGVYVALVFLPFFLAGMVWPWARAWPRRLAELLGALVLMKLVIVTILSLGLGALAEGEGVQPVLVGTAMFLLAAFSPFVLLSLIPLAGDVASHQRQGRQQLAVATGSAVGWQMARANLLQRARALPSTASASRFTTSGRGGGGGPIPPSTDQSPPPGGPGVTAPTPPRSAPPPAAPRPSRRPER